MTDRPARLAAPVIVLGLLLAGCSDGADGADDPPSPTSSASTPTGSETPEAGGEPCDAIDTAALAETFGFEFDEVTPYEEGKNAVDGCYLASAEGQLSALVDIRDDHGDLEADLQEFSNLPRKAIPEPATIAGLEALTASGSQAGVTVASVAMHLEDDRLLMVTVLNPVAEDVTVEDAAALSAALAEMVVPVL